MKPGYKILIFFIASLIIIAFIFQPRKTIVEQASTKNSKISTTKTRPGQATLPPTTSDFSSEINDKKKQQSIDLPEGVSSNFRDKPKFQAQWMKHGQDITLNNVPEADSADFRNTFFHRGFRDRPVTCGEVEFSKDNGVITAFQKFIYVGVQSSYLENDFRNFDILWSKMCVQTFEE